MAFDVQVYFLGGNVMVAVESRRVSSAFTHGERPSTNLIIQRWYLYTSHRLVNQDGQRVSLWTIRLEMYNRIWGFSRSRF